MGLDMYLYAKKYLSSYDNEDKRVVHTASNPKLKVAAII